MRARTGREEATYLALLVEHKESLGRKSKGVLDAIGRLSLRAWTDRNHRAGADGGRGLGSPRAAGSPGRSTADVHHPPLSPLFADMTSDTPYPSPQEFGRLLGLEQGLDGKRANLLTLQDLRDIGMEKVRPPTALRLGTRTD